MNDLISRQSALELVHTMYPSAPIMRINRERWKEKYKPYIEIEKALELLPSAQPEQNKLRCLVQSRPINREEALKCFGDIHPSIYSNKVIYPFRPKGKRKL